MKLYSTFSQSVEEFTVRDHQPVSIYVCGITPYDTTHLGHAFTYTCMDNLIRYLEFNRKKVHYVQNVTDIDDDILRKARQSGKEWDQLGNEWTNHFIEDMLSLNVRAPDEYPRATEVIPAIIEMVQGLLEKGIAYESHGNVYYAVKAWPDFGRLSHLDYAQMLPIANERGNHPDDPNKRDPLDFVLWQARAPGEPHWTSPWGAGRPGWHIECSAMATKFLGPVVDIHSGGADLCFPHHECEIAQVLPITQQKAYVRYWLHVAMVRYQGEKMSKSLGNLVMVSDLLKSYSADDLRLFLSSHHYRDSWSYEEKDLQNSAFQVKKLTSALQAASGTGDVLASAPFVAAFVGAMDSDLNTPQAVDTLTDMAHSILDAASGRRQIKEAQKQLRTLAGVLGLQLDKPGVAKEVKSWKYYLR